MIQSNLSDRVDPTAIYDSETIARIWRMSKPTRLQWYNRLREITDGSVRKNGAHFLLSGLTAFETFPCVTADSLCIRTNALE